MPEEAIKEETLTFKSEHERLQALSGIESDPPRNITSEADVNDWVKEQEEKQKNIIEAEIVPEEEAAPEPQAEEPVEPEPQAQEKLPLEPQAQEEPQEEPPQPVEDPPQEEDVVQFSYNRDDLPDELKTYKDPEEIIRQAAHARKYANQAEIKMKELAEEKERMAAELEALKKQEVSAAPEVPQPEEPVNDLAESLQKIEAMEETDYMTKADLKDTFGLAVDEITKAKKELRQIKSEFGGKLNSIEETNKATLQKNEKKVQMEATVRSIDDLQDKYPELKTNKPPFTIMGDDSVERDVQRWADRVLFSKYANDKPGWNERNALINAYNEGDSEITAYCEQNAITPESVGSTGDDVKKYAMLVNIDANMRGEAIDRATGAKKQKISPFNNKPVNYESYIASYENLKKDAGITQKEVQEKIAAAEIRGQESLAEAMDTRAAAPKIIGDKGATPPEAVKEMDAKSAWAVIDKGNEDEMERRALNGDRSLFNEYNKALKTVGFPEEGPSAHWPPEKQ